MTLRGLVQGEVEKLGLGHDWTVDGLISAVRTQRYRDLGRHLVIHELPWGMPVETCALWVAVPERNDRPGIDVLLRRPTTNPRHALQLEGHELGHVVLEPLIDLLGASVWRRAAAAIRPTLAAPPKRCELLTDHQMDDLVDCVNQTLDPDIGAVDASMVRARRRGTRGYDHPIEAAAELFGTQIVVSSWPEGRTPRDAAFAAFDLESI